MVIQRWFESFTFCWDGLNLSHFVEMVWIFHILLRWFESFTFCWKNIWELTVYDEENSVNLNIDLFNCSLKPEFMLWVLKNPIILSTNMTLYELRKFSCWLWLLKCFYWIMYFNVPLAPEQCRFCGNVRPAKKLLVFPGRVTEEG